MNGLLKIMAVGLLIGASVTFSSCSLLRHSRPNPDKVANILDSICTEGYNLFLAECVNWVATDSVLEHYERDSIGGNVIWQPTDSTWKAVFFDSEFRHTIFELCFNMHTGKYDFSYDKRPSTEMEIKQRELRASMFENAFRRYGDSLRYNSSLGRLNFDFVRVNDSTIRMYILQGTERTNVIPFGNDYSIDFDNDGNLIAFRRYHHSLIAISTEESNDERDITVHSHLKDNPYITPTDICNFLLYRGIMTTTQVYSTALDSFIIYDAERNAAYFIPAKVYKKIGKDKNRH